MTHEKKQPRLSGINPESAPDTPAVSVECELVDPPRRGRPSKRTPELEAQIADCFRLGMSIAQTCDACEISQTQFRNWRKRYRDFQELIRRAEAEGVRLNLSVIQAAALSGKSWQAAAWFLERKYPEQWGRTETLSIEARKDAVKEAIRIGPGRTPEQLKELCLALQLDRVASPEMIEAAFAHVKAEYMRRKNAEIFRIPFEPIPFDPGELDEKQESKRPGISAETRRKIEKLVMGDPPPSRAEKIEAIIELQAKVRELAGQPKLSKPEAFEAAARELDRNSGDTKSE